MLQRLFTLDSKQIGNLLNFSTLNELIRKKLAKSNERKLLLQAFLSKTLKACNMTRNGGFHQTKKLKVPDHIILMFQPSNSPESNSIEQV